MSDFKYLDYEGLATYTEQVKGYTDGKIVYLSDESEIPDPPKEGTLYVIGSEILIDEEIIIGTQTSSTSEWTGKSIDTRLHNGKRIAYYLPYPSVEGVISTLSLELSDEYDTITPRIRIMSEGGDFDRAIPGGSVIRMTYFENVMMNGAMRSGWICDGNIIQNNVTYTGTLVDEQVAIFEGSTGTIKSSGYTIAKSVPSSAVFTDTKNTAGSADSSSKLYLIGAESQAANPQTYSHDTAYIGTDGCLYSNSEKVITASDIATSTTDGIMLSEDKTKLDKIQDFYEFFVDLNDYPGGSYTENLTVNAKGVSALNIGDKIRIKSNLDFPTSDQVQTRVWAPGFEMHNYTIGLDGTTSWDVNGILRWPTNSDTDILVELNMSYNNNYAYPNQALLKYGGFIDVIVIGILSGTPTEYICAPLFNNHCGYIAPSAIDATNATNADHIYISEASLDASYPLVFTNSAAVGGVITNGDKSLFTNSYNLLHYNPSSNTLTVPTASIANAKVNVIGNITADSTITFIEPVHLKSSSYVEGLMNFKGSDHTSTSLTINGGSSLSAPSITIKSNDLTNDGIILTGRKGSEEDATIKVYSKDGSVCTITGGSTTITSDERLKNFENNIEIDFNKLKKIPKKYFTWKQDDEKKLNIGTSAQEIEKLYPEIVGNFLNDDGENYKSVDYSKLSIIALAAIDKLNERIEYLENKLKEYEK